MDAKARYPQSRYQLSHLAEQQMIIRHQANLIASLMPLIGSVPRFSQLHNLVAGHLLNADLSDREVQQILNLRTAISFIVSSPQGYDLTTFGHVNDLVTEGIGLNGGDLRRSPVVTIGMATRQIPVPDQEQVQKDLLDLRLNHVDYTDRALQTIAYILRHQLFRDGNAVTALLVGNQILAKRGAGLFMIPAEYQMNFKQVLNGYYHGDDQAGICRWLYNHALMGPDNLH